MLAAISQLTNTFSTQTIHSVNDPTAPLAEGTTEWKAFPWERGDDLQTDKQTQRQQVHRGCKHILTSYTNMFHFSCFPHQLKRKSMGALVPLAAYERSAELSPGVALKEQSSTLALGYSSHLFKCPSFCLLRTTAEEASASAVTSLQQKSGENCSFEPVTCSETSFMSMTTYSPFHIQNQDMWLSVT